MEGDEKSFKGGLIIFLIILVLSFVWIVLIPHHPNETLKAMWDKLTPEQRQEIIDDYIAHTPPEDAFPKAP